MTYEGMNDAAAAYITLHYYRELQLRKHEIGQCMQATYSAPLCFVNAFFSPVPRFNSGREFHFIRLPT